MCNHDELCDMIQAVHTELKEHIKDEDRTMDKLVKAQEANAKAIADLTKEVSDLLVIYRDFTGFIKIGAKVGNFFKWVGSFAIVAYIVDYFVDNLG